MSHITLNTDQRSILIRDLVIEDPRAHRILSLENPDKAEQKLRDALTIGFLAIDRTAAMAESDWVTQRLEQQIHQVNYVLERRSQEMLETIRNQFDPSKAGSLLAPVSDLVHRTQRELTARLTDTMAAINDSQGKLGRVLDETFDTDSRTSRVQQFSLQMAEMIGRFEGSIDPQREGTALAQFLFRFEGLTQEVSNSPILQAKLDDLRDEVKAMATAFKVGADAEVTLNAAKDAMTNASPAKGLVFEDQVREELKRIAEIRNDLIESVGTSPGKGTSKKGDFIYYLSSAKARIVFELKDYSSSRFTFQKIRDLMSETCINRDATFGVFLVKDESCLPDGVGRFFIADDFLIATQDSLEIPYETGKLFSYRFTPLNPKSTMLVTGTSSPYDFFRAGMRFETKSVSHLITQDVFLMAGAEDHYIPFVQLAQQNRLLTKARSISSRVFTRQEQAHEHCQVGNMGLSVDVIVRWLNGLETRDQALNGV